jgi:hypothetical protein
VKRSIGSPIFITIFLGKYLIGFFQLFAAGAEKVVSGGVLLVTNN